MPTLGVPLVSKHVSSTHHMTLCCTDIHVLITTLGFRLTLNPMVRCDASTLCKSLREMPSEHAEAPKGPRTRAEDTPPLSPEHARTPTRNMRDSGSGNSAMASGSLGSMNFTQQVHVRASYHALYSTTTFPTKPISVSYPLRCGFSHLFLLKYNDVFLRQILPPSLHRTSQKTACEPLRRWSSRSRR